MSVLAEHLKVRTPLLWINTDEPRRVINEVVSQEANRIVFRMDLLDGLVQYDIEKSKWIKTLVEDPDEPGSWVPTKDLNIALLHVLLSRNLMILEHAHKTVEMLIAFLSYVSRNYIDAFFADDNNHIPASFVLISCKDEVPPELRRDTVKVQYELPNEEQVHEIMNHVSEHTFGVKPEEDTQLVRAGLGLSELEIAQTCALSLKQFNCLDHAFINQTKLDKLKADGILEIRVPKIKLSDIGGLDNAKELMSRVAWTWNNPEEARQFETEPLRRVLLVGVPGTGKSAICEAAADALQLELAKFGTSQMMNKYVGESEANMRRAFAQVKAMKPLVLWIDEFGRDMSGGQSSGSVDSGTTDRVHGEFLQGLQELPDEVFLVCAANNISSLPPEMTRADRFDKIMFVGFPTAQERIEIFRIHLGASFKDFDLPKLAQNTAMFTGAEIKALIKEVRFRVAGDHQRRITTDDLLAFAPQMKGRVWTNHTASITEMYTRAKTEWAWASSAQEAEADQVLAAAGQTQYVNRPQEQKKMTNMFGGALKG